MLGEHFEIIIVASYILLIHQSLVYQAAWFVFRDLPLEARHVLPVFLNRVASGYQGGIHQDDRVSLADLPLRPFRLAAGECHHVPSRSFAEIVLVR